MADMTYQGPQTTHRVEPDRQGQGAEADLSRLAVAPNVMEAAPTALPNHTGESVENKWKVRTFDTGVVIDGRIVRSAV